jgi:hypothetical protein
MRHSYPKTLVLSILLENNKKASELQLDHPVFDGETTEDKKAGRQACP